ncbi:MAG TPA: CBS domain-containing protein [Methanomicrobiales archaeon]|nr:CBS domain-containing protein [Methanomicrobiales archaeon]
MVGSIRIGRIFGIPVILHWSLLLAIPLFTLVIGTDIPLLSEPVFSLFRVSNPDTSLLVQGWDPYLLGAVVSLALFACVLIHELAHCVVALRRGIRINSITLLILGGISSIENELPDPRDELPMALAGPLMSLALGVLSSILVLATTSFVKNMPVAAVLVFLFGYLALLNLILFVFNLLPAFPMDGGRVLRAWLAERMPLAKATRIAADIGKIFAVIFGIFGVFVVFNPVLIIIAFFIYIGADQEFMALRTTLLLRDVAVRDVMSPNLVTVAPEMPVPEVIRLMYSTKHLGFPVVEMGRLVGMVTLEDVHRTSEIDRDAKRVGDIMVRTLLTLPPTAMLSDAFRLMSRYNVGRIPIVSENTLLGIVTRTDILKVMELREA